MTDDELDAQMQKDIKMDALFTKGTSLEQKVIYSVYAAWAPLVLNGTATREMITALKHIANRRGVSLKEQCHTCIDKMAEILIERDKIKHD